MSTYYTLGTFQALAPLLFTSLLLSSSSYTRGHGSSERSQSLPRSHSCCGRDSNETRPMWSTPDCSTTQPEASMSHFRSSSTSTDGRCSGVQVGRCAGVQVGRCACGQVCRWACGQVGRLHRLPGHVGLKSSLCHQPGLNWKAAHVQRGASF